MLSSWSGKNIYMANFFDIEDKDKKMKISDKIISDT